MRREFDSTCIQEGIENLGLTVLVGREQHVMHGS